MKKLYTLIVCVFLLQIIKVGAANPVRLSSFENSTRFLVDTNLLAVSHVPVSAYQNVIFKRRLDSIQKDVPLNYNEYVQGYIDNYMRRPAEIGRMLGLSKYYFPIYEKAFRDAGIPDEIKFLSIVESELNPNATSRVGASGLWQFMSETAKIYGLGMNDYVDERRDPIQASYAAAAYLKDAYQQFGDWLLAIASYNCGKSNVLHAMERTGTNDFWSIRQYLPQETRGYVPAYIAMSYIMNYYSRHKILPQACDLALKTDTVVVSKFVPLTKISMALGVSYKELTDLNPAYRMAIVNGTKNAPRKLIIPQVNKDRYAVLYEVLTNPDAPVKQIAAAPHTVLNETGVKPAPPVSGYYTTKDGETLADIAGRYGVAVEDLMLWNKTILGIKKPRLQGGITLKVTRG